MNRSFRGFLSAFSLLSRVPLKLTFEPDFSRMDFWLPVVGVAASAFALAGFYVAYIVFAESLLVAVAALFFQYWGFNLFHLDGLLDSADALAGHADRARRLEILKDSRIGSFAFFYGFFAIVAKLATIAALVRSSPAWAAAALLAAPVAGRTACAFVPLLGKSARSEGLGAMMRDFSPLFLALGWLAGSLPLLLFALGSGGTTLAVAAAASSIVGATGAGVLLSSLYTRKIGGFTGDALGAAVEAGELFSMLLMLAVFSRLNPG